MHTNENLARFSFIVLDRLVSFYNCVQHVQQPFRQLNLYRYALSNHSYMASVPSMDLQSSKILLPQAFNSKQSSHSAHLWLVSRLIFVVLWIFKTNVGFTLSQQCLNRVHIRFSLSSYPLYLSVRWTES